MEYDVLNDPAFSGIGGGSAVPPPLPAAEGGYDIMNDPAFADVGSSAPLPQIQGGYDVFSDPAFADIAPPAAPAKSAGALRHNDVKLSLPTRVAVSAAKGAAKAVDVASTPFKFLVGGIADVGRGAAESVAGAIAAPFVSKKLSEAERANADAFSRLVATAQKSKDPARKKQLFEAARQIDQQTPTLRDILPQTYKTFLQTAADYGKAASLFVPLGKGKQSVESVAGISRAGLKAAAQSVAPTAALFGGTKALEAVSNRESLPEAIAGTAKATASGAAVSGVLQAAGFARNVAKAKLAKPTPREAQIAIDNIKAQISGSEGLATGNTIKGDPALAAKLDAVDPTKAKTWDSFRKTLLKAVGSDGKAQTAVNNFISSHQQAQLQSIIYPPKAGEAVGATALKSPAATVAAEIERQATRPRSFASGGMKQAAKILGVEEPPFSDPIAVADHLRRSPYLRPESVGADAVGNASIQKLQSETSQIIERIQGGTVTPRDIVELSAKVSQLGRLVKNAAGNDLVRVNTILQKPLSQSTAKDLEGFDEQTLRTAVAQQIDRQRAAVESSFFGSENLTAAEAEALPRNELFPGSGLLGKVQEPIRKASQAGENVVRTLIEKGSAAKNPFIRNAAKAISSFWGEAGISPAREAIRNDLMGGAALGSNEANNMYVNLRRSPAGSPQSMERIGAVLDPEVSKLKLTYDDLTPDEREAYDLIRAGNDLIHSRNFANGFIDKETYLKNLGNYSARLYEPYEFQAPPEVQQHLKDAYRKIDLAIYKGREDDVTDWFRENALKDPAYALAKRWAQTESNDAILNYTKQVVARTPYLVSDVAKPGFIQLSDSKAYGSLSGKYVAQPVAEDIKGFYYSSNLAQKTYDLFKTYDRLPPRQFVKSMLTVWNPSVQVGNAASDNVFGFLVGVDPLTLNSNVPRAVSEIAEFGPTYRYLLSKNVLNSNLTKVDLQEALVNLDAEYEKASRAATVRDGIRQVAAIPKKVYGAVDDVYKVAAFKSLRDQGFSDEDALKLVSDGFQNYKTVGKLWDTAARTPVIGNAFIRFQADLQRLIKNAVLHRPLSTAAFLGTLKLMGDVSSQVSGETPAEKKVRESRAFTPGIPLPFGLPRIPLSFQTPFGEINAARMISPYFLYSDPQFEGSQGLLNKTLPYQVFNFGEYTTSPSGQLGVWVGKSTQDPVLGPLLQLAANSDFRGKPILDPTETKYAASTATPAEKAGNAIRFLYRAYEPQTSKDFEDYLAALRGDPDFYGRFKSPEQAFIRFFGLKLEPFGEAEAKAAVAKDFYYEFLDFKATIDQIKSIVKASADPAAKNPISQQVARDRLEIQYEKLAQILAKMRSTQGSIDDLVGILPPEDVATFEETTGAELPR